jgi:hypothetical protein
VPIDQRKKIPIAPGSRWEATSSITLTTAAHPPPIFAKFILDALRAFTNRTPASSGKGLIRVNH